MYIPIIKTGEAEIKASEKLTPGMLDRITPIIELTRGRQKTTKQGNDKIVTYPFDKRLAKMKKQRAQWFIIGLIFVLICFVWFCAELIMGSKYAGQDALSYFVIGGSVIGGIIGFIIAWIIFRKMQKTNNQLIEQINQITKED